MTAVLPSELVANKSHSCCSERAQRREKKNEGGRKGGRESERQRGERGRGGETDRQKSVMTVVLPSDLVANKSHSCCGERAQIRERDDQGGIACLLVGCLTSQQHASVSHGWICSDNFTCCHTETDVADPTFHLTQSQYTDTGPASPRAYPISITPGAWQGSHWSANF